MRVLMIITMVLVALNFTAGQSIDTILYSTRDKITWDDFKGRPTDKNNRFNADLVTTIQMETTNVNVWTGVASFNVVAVIFRDLSWVKEDKKTAEELRHQQLYYDICEVVARRLKADINSRRINAGRKKKIQEVFDSYDKVLQEMSESYAVETRLGEDRAKQAEWEDRIWKELGKN